MAKKSAHKIIQELNLTRSQDWAGMAQELFEGSDRSTAILGGVYLDEQLKQLLLSFLIEDRKLIDELLGVENPLATFSARIKMVYALGLINKVVYDDLQTIRNIRNAFAHTLHGLSFTHPDINGLVQSIRVLDHAIPNKVADPEPRAVYILATLILSSYLLAKKVEVMPQQQDVPNDLHIIEWKRIAAEETDKND